MELSGHTRALHCLAQLSDGALVSGGYDKQIRMWDPDSGVCLLVLEGHLLHVSCIVELQGGKLKRASLFLSGSPDRTLRIWDRHRGECVRQLPRQDSAVYCAVQLDDERLASGIGNGISVFKIHEQQETCELRLDGHKVIHNIMTLIRSHSVMKRQALESSIPTRCPQSSMFKIGRPNVQCY